jgi:hypothetical protein
MTSQRLVGVRLERHGPVRYFDAGGLELAVRQRVMVPEGERLREGLVVVAPGQVLHCDLQTSLERVRSVVGGPGPETGGP